MTVDFSLETMQARRKEHIFQVLKEKLSNQNSLSNETILRDEGETKTSSSEGKTKTIYHQQTSPERMAAGSSSNRRETDKRKAETSGIKEE